MNTTSSNEQSNFNDIVQQMRLPSSKVPSPTITPTLISSDNIINKINGEDRRRVEPEFSKILYQFTNKTFIPLNNMETRKYEFTHVDNFNTQSNSNNETFQIIGLPKYNYNNSVKAHPMFDLPEMTLIKYPMPSRKYAETYVTTMNAIEVVFNKKNKAHRAIIDKFQSISDATKNSGLCTPYFPEIQIPEELAKNSHNEIVKPFKKITHIQDPENEDNYKVKMSFYTNGKQVLSRITKSYEGNPTMGEEIEDITIEQLSALISGNVKASMVIALPSIWLTRFKNNSNNLNNGDANAKSDDFKIMWGTSIKIVSIHIEIPTVQNKVGHGKFSNLTLRKVNYSLTNNHNNKTISIENKKNEYLEPMNYKSTESGTINISPKTLLCYLIPTVIICTIAAYSLIKLFGY